MGARPRQKLFAIYAQTPILPLSPIIYLLLWSSIIIGFELILLGGIYQPVSLSVGGYFSIDNLKQVYADKTFIGIDGISLKYGCTFPTSDEAEVVRTMMERTRGPVYVVADHSKWGTVSNYLVANIEKIHSLITDDAFDMAARESLSAQSVKVLIAGNST